MHPVGDRTSIQVTRLLCVLGALLVPLSGVVLGASSPEASPPLRWGHYGMAGLLLALAGASYVSGPIRRRHVTVTWGLLGLLLAWVTVLAALNEFTAEYALGVFFVYAVSGALAVVLGSSLRALFAFLAMGALFVGAALLWSSSPQTSPWALGGGLIVVALAEGAAARWAQSVRARLRTQTRTLREQRELLDGLMETSPNAIVCLDEDGTFVDVKGRVEDTLGARPGALLGRSYDDLPWETIPADGEATENTLPFEDVVRAGRTVHNRPCSVEGPDGTQRRLSVSGAPLPSTHGTARAALFHLDDVTDREQRRHALEKAQAEAAEADRLKSALLANMSHEIRTPLTAIIGFAEVIGNKTSALELPEDSPLPGYANLIEQSATRLLDTLEGVLDLSQLEAGLMELDAEPIALDEQARRAVEDHRPDAQENDITLQLDGPRTEAKADVNGVQLVLQNLLDNAIKYTEEGGTVSVRTYQESNRAVLEVEDTGVGMEPGRVDQLFEPFRQASTGLDREYEGAGIGLAVIKKATEQMGGSIEVQTEAGTGTRILARLPTPADAPPPDGGDQELPERQATSP